VALYLHQLQKNYVAPDGSSLAVIDVDYFSIADTEQVSLIGTSGSGKTTLLHLIAGIVTPDAGRITYELPGQGKVDISTMGEAERDVFRGRNIGYIFQTHHLLGGFSARENVLLAMSFTGRPAERGWAEHLLEEVGLKDRLDYKPAKLSVGQQQRVAVARALANRPKLVLADEPTGALDVNNARQVMQLIRSLCAEVGASLLLVSHDLEIARQLPRVVSLGEINRAMKEAVATAGLSI
jgi:putative ABC transport system ATP-binding protein